MSNGRLRAVDTSRRLGPAAPEVVASEPAELLMSVVVAFGGAEAGDYDLGPARIEALRAAVPPDLYDRMAVVIGGTDKIVAELLGLVLRSGSTDVGAFFDALSATPADDLVATLLGARDRPFCREKRFSPEVALEAVRGNPAAQQRMKEVHGEWPRWLETLERLFRVGHDEVKAVLVESLPRWYEEVFAPYREETLTIISSDAEAKRTMAQTMPLDRFVEIATNGLQRTRQEGIERLVMYPTYWLKPWLIQTFYDDAEIITYPVADSSVRSDDSGPPPALVKLYKALGDEGRLRLLKRLRAGPITLKEAAEALGVSKSTAHHHLALLRQAGLVFFRVHDGDKLYSLRTDPVPAARELLERYLR